MNATTTTKTLGEIELLAKIYAADRQLVADRVQHLSEEIAALKKRLVPGIKSAAVTASATKAELKLAIEGAPGLFVKPRTYELHGIKCGFAKGKGKLDWDDDDKVVALIKRHSTEEEAELLIATKETPAAKALAQLSAADLKKFGITVESTGDVVVIKAKDTDIDKLVAALLEEGEQDASDDAKG